MVLQAVDSFGDDYVGEAEDEQDRILEILVRAAGKLPPDSYTSELACRDLIQDFGRFSEVGSRPQCTALPQKVVALDKPVTLGPYELLARIGVGGMAEVYRARQMRFGTVSAVKVLQSQAHFGEQERSEAVRRFRREIQISRRVRHPTIVQALHADEINGVMVLEMEEVDGLSWAELTTYLGNQGTKISIAAACELVRQAAEGLAAAHEQGIVHRDIKPSNLMLDRDGRVRILDLGLARVIDPPDKQALFAAEELTRVGQVMGTLDYMSPEQLRDSHNVDQRTDVYALGATLFKILTGKIPYGDERYTTAEARIMALASDPVPDVQVARPDAPDELVNIVERMLAKDPANRLDSAANVALLLQPFASAEAARAVAQQMPRRTSEQQTTNQVNVSTWLVPHVGLEITREVEVKRQSQRRRWLLAVTIIVALSATFVGFSKIDRGLVSTALRVDSAAITRPSNTRGAPPARRALDERWLPGSAENVFPGLASNPATFPGIRRWQVDTAMPRATALAVRWNPAGTDLAVLSNDGNVRIYGRTDTGLELRQLFPGHGGSSPNHSSLSWNPDGTRLAVTAQRASGSIAVVHEVGASRMGTELIGHDGNVTGIEWSPDGSQLVSCGQDGTVRLWAADGNPQSTFGNDSQPLRTVTWHPQGHEVAAVDEDGVIRVWSLHNAQLRMELRDATARLQTVAWNPVDFRLAAGGADGAIRIWSEQGELQFSLKAGSNDVWCLAWHPNGSALAAGGAEVWFWKNVSAEPRLLLAHDDQLSWRIPSLHWNPHQNTLVMCGPRSLLQEWNADEDRMSSLLGSGPVAGRAVRWNRAGSALAVSTSDDRLRILSQAGNVLDDWSIPNSSGDGLASLDWSPDDRFLAGGENWGAGDGGTRIWEVATGQQVWRGGVGAAALRVAWSDDGHILAAASASNTAPAVFVYDINATDFGSTRIYRITDRHRGAVNAIAWNPQTRQLASASEDGRICLWNVGDNGLIEPLDEFTDMPHAVIALAFQPHGDHLAAASWNPDATVFLNLKTKEFTTLPSYSKSHDLAWLADGSSLAIGDNLVEPVTKHVKPFPWGFRFAFGKGDRFVATTRVQTLHVFDRTTDQELWTALLLPEGKTVTLTAAGQVIDAAPGAMSQLRYLIETESGNLELLSLDEFARRIGRPIVYTTGMTP